MNTLKSLRSNVKGNIEVTFDSPYVLVTGANGSGKSAIVHSIELACFGQVRDASGRDSKSKSHLEHLS